MLSVVTDAPVGSKSDSLSFDRYIDPLITILTNPRTETPFTIGIFGSWGSGKSSLLRMLNERLESGFPERFVRVNFNPWVHRHEENLLTPLLYALYKSLEQDPKRRFVESAKKVASIVTRLVSDTLLKRLTGDVASLDRIEELEIKYREKRGQVQEQLAQLRDTLAEEAQRVADKGARIVVFIDDLDRCDPTEIIDLLEALKLFLDVEHVFIVLAIAKDLVDRGVSVKYKDFQFLDQTGALAVGEEYLEKMVQLPLYLYPLGQHGIGEFVASLDCPPIVQEQSQLLESVLLPNPRKIKRVLNILAVTGAVIEATPSLAELQLDVVTRIVVLRVQSSDLYSQVTSQPKILVALERLYAGDIRAEEAADFAGFCEARESIRTIATAWHRPGTYLARLFKDAGFVQLEEKLPTYLTMLG